MNQISFESLLFEDNKTVEPPPPLSSPLENFILTLISKGQISARDICEQLIEQNKISTERYSTDKPKDFHKVCKILDGFVVQGKLSLSEDKEKTDRIYKVE
ncbi:DUF3895 domain-containing protein [Bacillus sp. MUM 13]|uniref:DUF3895 domain-containing protein n=1 Tax=Bacillus sp. MUM 13 TaxID=1678001 RepID=UPI0008F56123|nr:DUF3895 domain-containing protein [Bacillus sp. MUM 13]OIK09584.1 hypothetical protein BIV59_16600 [Bacillus sp. MUM 13]